MWNYFEVVKKIFKEKVIDIVEMILGFYGVVMWWFGFEFDFVYLKVYFYVWCLGKNVFKNYGIVYKNIF